MPRLSRRRFVASGAATPAFLAAQPRPYETPTGEVNHPGRNLLSGGYPPEKIATLLKPRSGWKPFPSAADRGPWESLPAAKRSALVATGEKSRQRVWPRLPATWFLDYVRIGNRTKADGARHRRRAILRELVLAECIEHQGRFLDAILNAIWSTCEESYWGSPAHLSMQKAGTGLPDVEEPTVDLFAADTAAVLAWTDYLVGADLAQLSPLIRPRIWYEVNRRVLTPCEQRDDFWWMGLKTDGPRRALNNWTPWIDSNWLAANLLLEPDENRRRRAVHRILRSLDRFLEGYHDDGGCDEGPSYWNRAGGSLFDCLELLHSASGGRINVYDDPLIGNIGRYIVRAHIYDDWFVNFADASAKVRPDGSLVYSYGKRIGDRDMQLLGAWAAGESHVLTSGSSRDFTRELPTLFALGELAAAEQRQPLVRDVWLSGIQMMAARSAAGSPRGLYVAAHGGHNAESHNHNDVGDFIVYADGRPAIIDIGVETYSAKTFSSHRYEIWTMQSAWHNLPTVDGVMQAAGRRFAARDVSYKSGERSAELSLDIAAAYPADAGIKSWKRSIRLDRDGNTVLVGDRYELAKKPREITQTFMTPGPVSQPEPGRLSLAGVSVAFDPAVFQAKTEEVAIKDRRLRSSWGDRLYRVRLRAASPPAAGGWSFRITQV